MRSGLAQSEAGASGLALLPVRLLQSWCVDALWCGVFSFARWFSCAVGLGAAWAAQRVLARAWGAVAVERCEGAATSVCR